MIKFSGTHDDVPLIGFGLSRANCERLIAGQPILISAEQVAKMVPGLRAAVLIVGGESETAMYDELKAAGMVGPETQIHPLEEL